MKTTENNIETKVIRKRVNVIVRDDLKYIVIYEVRAIKTDGEIITIERFLDESSANSYVEFCYEHYKSVYDCLFVREQWVRC